MHVFVARQPIYDRSYKTVVAYELLFRNGLENSMPISDGEEATRQTISNAFLNIGIDHLTGEVPAFINFTRDLLLAKTPLILPPKALVVEILEGLTVDQKLVSSCEDLKNAGYRLAIDDFEDFVTYKPLLELAEIIKLDFMVSTEGELRRLVEQLKPFSHLQLLAEKVETTADLKLAQELGCSLFQGYYFSKPQIIKGKTLPPSAATYMQLMKEVATENPNMERIEALIQNDVGISYKLMHYINSAVFSFRQQITSIRLALVYMGLQDLFRFVSLAILTTYGKEVSPELVRQSCIRGRFCELLSHELPMNLDGGELFTLGMFSLLDTILQIPMSEICQDMPFSESLKQALCQDQSEALSVFLLLCENYERADWKEVENWAKHLQVPVEKLPVIYLQATEWAEAVRDKS